MKLLENSSREISSLQKQQLYRCCIFLIVLYEFQLWFYNKVLLSYHMKLLSKFHLQKLANRSLIQPFKLLKNHIIKNLMDNSLHHTNISNPHAIGSLTNWQRNIVKGHIIDSKIKSYGIFPSFDPFHQEFTPGHCVSDKFSDHFSFNLVNKKGKDNIRAQELDDLVLQNSLSSSTLIVTDASIKNNIATSVAHVHQANSPLIKTVHHAVFITSSEAELFAMRCGINQACNKDNISKIIVITDSIHSAKLIFDSSSHLLQSYLAAILSKLRLFFNKSQDNSIEFWECPSCLKWRFHKDVDKDSKSFKPTPSFPCKTSWDFCKKTDSDNIIKQWKMCFQTSNGKENNFMDLLNNSFNIIKPSYIKGGPWLQAFRHSNSLYAKATQAITNHALIGEFHLRFFPNEDFKCPYNEYPIETRRHILHKCWRFNGYWNPRRDLISHFIMFLIHNPKAFAF